MTRIKKTACILFVIALMLSGCYPSAVTSIPVTVSDLFNVANSYQNPGGACFGAANQSIYRFVPKLHNSFIAVYTPDGSKLSTMTTISDDLFRECLPVGFSGNWFYFWSPWSLEQSLDDKTALYSYSLTESTTHKLIECTARDSACAVSFFSSDGLLHIIFEGSDAKNMVVENGAAAETISVRDVYALGDREYVLIHDDGSASELYEVRSGEERKIDLPYAKDRFLIPVEGNLLVCTPGAEHLLYKISSNGEITELFSIPCMVSDTAINVYGDYAFLSVERWEKSGQLGMLHYSDDQLQGCYRINWKTGEKQRCSDAMYNALFIFGEGGMIGCTSNGRVVWMDQEFRILQKID